MSIEFGDIFEELKRGIAKLAASSLKKFLAQAKSDGQKMLDFMKQDLENWTIQLDNKEINADDFKFLVIGQKDLLEMAALKQAGLALVQIDGFKMSVLNLIINTLTGAIKI